MRILHLSDLHFGTELPGLVENLSARLKEIPADLLIVSGDFTQVGSAAEFSQARRFLDSLEIPFLCVPGNHDIPRYSLLERLRHPYTRYQQAICDDLMPVYNKNDVCIIGINTARRILPHWNWAHGAISRAQLDEIENIYKTCTARVKILVMHHPVLKAQNVNFNTIVFGGAYAIERLRTMDINLVLTGHVHHASLTTMQSVNSHDTLFLSASTALSTRLRGSSANGYNVITIHDDKMTIEPFSYQENRFDPLKTVECKLP